MKNSKVEVLVPLKTNARHVQQVYTGLETMHKAGLISLRYEDKGNHSNDVFMEISINGKRVVVDCKDSDKIETELYEGCDAYFKRTLSAQDQRSMPKLYPFGLYFEVYPSVFSAHTVRRFLTFSDNRVTSRIKSLIKAVDLWNLATFIPRSDNFRADMGYSSDDTILFFTRLWDPDFDREFELAKHESEDRKQINELRIECVRALKQHFGDNALVGLLDDKYSRKIAPDLILPAEHTNQKNYFDLVGRAKVCVTSTGLHGSIGAKFSEYVAMGKIILSEPFEYVLPGEMAEGTNYLTYSSPEQCVQKIKDILASEDKNLAMMKANKRYFNDVLLPEKIVSRIIDTVVHN